jgi:hypothetical protein
MHGRPPRRPDFVCSAPRLRQPHSAPPGARPRAALLLQHLSQPGMASRPQLASPSHPPLRPVPHADPARRSRAAQRCHVLLAPTAVARPPEKAGDTPPRRHQPPPFCISCPHHRRAVRVPHLDPVPRTSRAVGCAQSFRHDAFEAELASMPEDRGSIFFTARSCFVARFIALPHLLPAVGAKALPRRFRAARRRRRKKCGLTRNPHRHGDTSQRCLCIHSIALPVPATACSLHAPIHRTGQSEPPEAEPPVRHTAPCRQCLIGFLCALRTVFQSPYDRFTLVSRS